MFKVSHANLTFISGLIWLGVGFFLMQLGLTLILNPDLSQALQSTSTPLLQFFQSIIGGHQEAAIALTAIALYLGFLKGKHVLSKSAKKGVDRICTFPNPTEITNIYSPMYYLLLLGMIGLGMSIKLLGLPNDVRGAVDVTIGAALIHGSIQYFRMGLNLRKAAAA